MVEIAAMEDTMTFPQSSFLNVEKTVLVSSISSRRRTNRERAKSARPRRSRTRIEELAEGRNV